MKSNHHVLYILGYKRHTMVTTKRRNLVIVSQSKNVTSVRIERLQLALMKLELLVIANQQCGGE